MICIWHQSWNDLQNLNVVSVFERVSSCFNLTCLWTKIDNLLTLVSWVHSIVRVYVKKLLSTKSLLETHPRRRLDNYSVMCAKFDQVERNLTHWSTVVRSCSWPNSWILLMQKEAELLCWMAQENLWLKMSHVPWYTVHQPSVTCT